MNDYPKPGWMYRACTAFGRAFYALRMRMEKWQDYIDAIAGRYDPDDDAT